MLNCKNNLCLFWKNERCGRDKVVIGVTGNCEKCVPIDLKADVEREARIRTMRAYNLINNGFDEETMRELKKFLADKRGQEK